MTENHVRLTIITNLGSVRWCADPLSLSGSLLCSVSLLDQQLHSCLQHELHDDLECRA